MNDWLQRMWDSVKNIGKPRFELGDNSKTKLEEADRTLDEIKGHRVELERRQKLLEIQANRRGY